MGSIIDDDVPELEQGLLQDERNKQYTGDGSVDFRGKPAIKHDTGNWRACPFILGNECCERLAFFGISTNLVTYLTTKLHEGNVSAARNVGFWQGTCYLTPLVGAVLADGYWGRYWTIAIFSMIYFLGMSILTISASLPSLKPAECLGSVCPPASPLQYYLLYFGLYVIALGTGGVKACVSSFGADQFDDTDSKERARKASFFNWFQKPRGSPVTRMCQVVLASVRKRKLVVPEDSSLLYEMPDKKSGVEGSRKLLHRDDLRYFDRAAVVSDSENRSGDYSNPWRLCTVSQMSTLFVEQGTMMDTNVSSFKLSPASLSTFDVASVIFWVPVYDRILVPIARKITGKKRGISVFQRMGIGLFISGLCMLSAAIVEIKRLQLARKLDLVDKPVAIPLSVLWQIPQYFLLGASEVFTFIGQVEFFYDESPDAMRSLCSALPLLSFSFGNYLSSFMLTIVTYFTTRGGKLGWIPDNLNKGHLDYFFLLLSGLSLLNMLAYIIAAKMYKQKKMSEKFSSTCCS
ncbi:unnamed protein product [Vicia faba]|uniref:Uncharacterized protein n=1 Tax=Vicia faba TaxID=3906 RepID=A0AAV1B8H4_VICFA|nr:unnamed protein product [Vicia faba]